MCEHKRWLIGTPVTRFSRPGNKGDLVETTEHTCKDCGDTRLNTCVIPPERLGSRSNT